MNRLADISVPDEVLARARGGDDAAQAAVYEAVAPAAFALIRRLVQHRAIAEDLFQDTMMTVFRRLDCFRGDAPFGAWVRQIAVSKCLMYLRSPWHRARIELDHAFEGEVDVAASLPSSSVPFAECVDLERALACLSPTARAVVWLFEVEGYSHQEIALAFGRTVSFSKSQLARAHRRLREWFEPRTSRHPCTPT